MFNPTQPFQYSIDVAASLYRTKSCQSEITKEIQSSVEKFFAENNLSYDYFVRDMGYLKMGIYHSNIQDITTVIDGKGDITGIHLNMNQPYSEELLKEAYYEKALFNAAVFVMIWLTDVNNATLNFISLEDYKKMDNPHYRQFQNRMNYLDNLINENGGVNWND
ncbi:MAG: hypothetical protein J1F10_07675 [Muribaculaceae bacterium]|nr:hypothetical protein [Muribaculaceae bacterium]